MPNYCENTLDITCPREVFNKLQPLLFIEKVERNDETDSPPWTMLNNQENTNA